MTDKRWRQNVSTTQQLMLVTRHAQRMIWHEKLLGNPRTRPTILKISRESEFVMTSKRHSLEMRIDGNLNSDPLFDTIFTVMTLENVF